MGVGTAASNSINQNGSRVGGGFITQEKLNELAAKDKCIIKLMRLKAQIRAQGTPEELKAATLEVCERMIKLHREFQRLRRKEKSRKTRGKFRAIMLEERIRLRLLEIRDREDAKYIRKLRRKMGGKYVKMAVGECRRYRYQNSSLRSKRRLRTAGESAPQAEPPKSLESRPPT